MTLRDYTGVFLYKNAPWRADLKQTVWTFLFIKDLYNVSVLKAVRRLFTSIYSLILAAYLVQLQIQTLFFWSFCSCIKSSVPLN